MIPQHPDDFSQRWKLRNSNLGSSLNNLINRLYLRYRGCLIEHDGDWLVWGGKRYPSKDAAFNAIDEELSKFGNNINTPPHSIKQ